MLPILTLPAADGRRAVVVSARGFWDRAAPPASTEAIVRARRRGIPVIVQLGQDEDLQSAELHRMIAGAAVSVPIIFEAPAEPTAARFTQEFGSLLRERLPGCKIVCGGEGDLLPVRELDGGPPWAWRLRIATLTTARDLKGLIHGPAPARLVYDSYDVLTTVAEARLYPPAREDELLRSLGDSGGPLELWRVTDLADGEFLVHFSRQELC